METFSRDSAVVFGVFGGGFFWLFFFCWNFPPGTGLEELQCWWMPGFVLPGLEVELGAIPPCAQSTFNMVLLFFPDCRLINACSLHMLAPAVLYQHRLITLEAIGIEKFRIGYFDQRISAGDYHHV